MATKSWPSLESSNKARRIGEDNNDLFRKLPEEIWEPIISSFTMNEAAKFSLVSRQCEIIWRYFPVLIFEDCKAKEKNWDSWDAIFEDRACFVWRVDRTLEKHLGTTIDELRITYDLERCWQSYVDKWVAIALDKQVKILELNFSTISRGISICDQPLLDLPPKLLTAGFKSCLTSLCLKHVNVTDEFIDYLPHSCPLLEMLCIQGSSYLTRVTGKLSALKQLEVYYCLNLKIINVSARKLQSFTLFSVFHVEVHIADAPSLFKMSIGWGEWELMNGVAMPKLKQLEILVSNARGNSSLNDCIYLIKASPNLQKLTLKLVNFDSNERRIRELKNWADYGYSYVFPIKCLKTLEVVGYRGKPVDLELAFFVLANASMLEEVIVDFIPPDANMLTSLEEVIVDSIPLNDNDKRERLAMLQMKLPQGVKLTMK